MLSRGSWKSGAAAATALAGRAGGDLYAQACKEWRTGYRMVWVARRSERRTVAQATPKEGEVGLNGQAPLWHTKAEKQRSRENAQLDGGGGSVHPVEVCIVSYGWDKMKTRYAPTVASYNLL